MKQVGVKLSNYIGVLLHYLAELLSDHQRLPRFRLGGQIDPCGDRGADRLFNIARLQIADDPETKIATGLPFALDPIRQVQ